MKGCRDSVRKKKVEFGKTVEEIMNKANDWDHNMEIDDEEVQ